MIQQTQNIDVRDWFDQDLQRKILQCLSVFFPQQVSFSTIVNQLNIAISFEFKLDKNLRYLIGHNLVSYCGDMFEYGRGYTPQFQITSIGIDNVINSADNFYSNIVLTTSLVPSR